MKTAATQDTATSAWPPVLVPTDRPRQLHVLARCSAVVQANLDVRAFAVEAARNDVLFAGFAALLHRYTGQDRIGLAVGTGQALLTVTAASTLRELADGRAPGTGSGPVGIRFAAQGELAGGAPLELELVVRPGIVELHYDAGLFDRATADRLLDHYRTLVEDGTRFPDRPVSRLRLLTDAERQRILVAWNATERDLPSETSLHQAFEATAMRTPDAVAVVQGARRSTYGDINIQANRIAHHLRSLGVGPETRVGLCLDRSPALLVALLGILKAGGAYVPVDPDYPTQRIAAMLDGTSCAVMISREALIANLPDAHSAQPVRLILLDRDAETLAAQPEHDLGLIAGPDDLCYIVHTSGSTGAPKPIALRHRGVMNNLADLNTRFQVGHGDSVLALSSLSFDMSVYELLGITIAGGTVVIPDQGWAKDPEHWAELLATHDITVWNSAPALLGLLTDYLEQCGAGHLSRLPKMRLAMLGGDWVPVTLADRIRAFAPDLRFIVMGGATEASIHSTIYEVRQTDPQWTSIPYGRPMANQRTYILDEALQPVPPGVPGELYLAGVGLARGYLDQPELTAERFIEWSHGDVSGESLYRTGDLAQFGPDGLIELLGRTDFQVKINGLRVELSEIEAVLRAHPGVRQTVVIALDGRLLAYIVPEQTASAPDADELRRLAAQLLPDFMVPSAFVTLDRLPLTPNGKLDRKGLPEPDFSGAEYRAPSSNEEEILADAYAAVLGRARVGVDDDFIAMGGDSIRAIQVVTRTRGRGIEITVPQVLQSRSVAALALFARAAVSDNRIATSALVAVRPNDLAAWTQRYPGLVDVWPLTPMQSGMLFESMLKDTGDDTYQLQTVYHLSGRVDAARMRAVGQAVMERHANLRAVFVPDSADNLVQLVVDGVRLPWREIDLSHLAGAERDEAFGQFLAGDRTVRFDPATPPLLRMTLVTLGPDRAELVLTAHHVLLDGWSEQVLSHELRRLYAAGGDTTALEPVRGFREFLAWLSRQDPEKSARAWADELSGVDASTTVVPDTVVPTGPVSDIGELVVALAPARSERLARYCATLGVTVNTLVQGAWAVLLSALTGREDVVFGATVSGRSGALDGVESMVGLFINTIPVRVRCAAGDTVGELLTGLASRQTTLLDHQHHSLTDIHRAAGLGALFDTLVAFQSYPADIADCAGDTGVEITGVDSIGSGSYPLSLIASADRLTFQYDQNLFDRDWAEDIAAVFRSVVDQFVADPGRLVGTVEVARAVLSVASKATVVRPDPAAAGYRKGRTPKEDALCELFAEILGVERVGIDDDFFALGGNSLTATRIIARLRRTLGIETPIRSIFQYPTIAELSGRLEAAGSKSPPGLRKMT